MNARPREPTLAELGAAAKGCTIPDRALLVRAAAGRDAVSFGADPMLTLALVVWPSAKVTAACEATRPRRRRRARL
ncbi:MAG: hypothetical protein ACXVZN_11450, partial [Gaiellaceae bacterium]